LAEDSKWDEEWLNHYLTYSLVFNDPVTRQAMRERKERLQRKGIFSAMYEMGEENGQGKG
jgi:hypothetical protein